MNITIDRLKLSAQRALLGNVPPNLRAVCVDLSEDKIDVCFYYNYSLSEENIELYNHAVDQIIADLWGNNVEFNTPFIRLDYPEKMPLKGFWVYYRNE